jgi:hypothetical protein
MTGVPVDELKDHPDLMRAWECLVSPALAPLVYLALVQSDVQRAANHAFDRANRLIIEALHAQGIVLRRASADADSGVSAAPTTPTRSTSHEAVDHSDFDPDEDEDEDEDATSNDTHTSAAIGCNSPIEVTAPVSRPVLPPHEPN